MAAGSLWDQVQALLFKLFTVWAQAWPPTHASYSRCAKLLSFLHRDVRLCVFRHQTHGFLCLFALKKPKTLPPNAIIPLPAGFSDQFGPFPLDHHTALLKWHLFYCSTVIFYSSSLIKPQVLWGQGLILKLRRRAQHGTLRKWTICSLNKGITYEGFCFLSKVTLLEWYFTNRDGERAFCIQILIQFKSTLKCPWTMKLPWKIKAFPQSSAGGTRKGPRALSRWAISHLEKIRSLSKELTAQIGNNKNSISNFYCAWQVFFQM